MEKECNIYYRVKFSKCICTDMHMCMHVKALQLCLTLCDPIDYCPPGPSARGILQERRLKWVAVPSSRDPHAYMMATPTS